MPTQRGSTGRSAIHEPRTGKMNCGTSTGSGGTVVCEIAWWFGDSWYSVGLGRTRKMQSLALKDASS